MEQDKLKIEPQAFNNYLTNLSKTEMRRSRIVDNSCINILEQQDNSKGSKSDIFKESNKHN